MKKLLAKISLFAGCVFMVTSVSAQNLSLGVRGGTQWSQFSEFATSNGIQGANVGLTAVYSTKENFGYGADLLFSRNGGDFSMLNTLGEEEYYRVQNDYVRFVPKAMWFFRDVEDRFRPKVTLGLNVGFMTKSQDIDRNLVMNETFRTVDGAAQLGLGFNLKIASRTWLQFDAEYMLGFVEAEDYSTYYPSQLYNNTLSLNGGIAFGIGQ